MEGDAEREAGGDERAGRLTFCVRLECVERPEPCEERGPVSSFVRVMVEACEGGYKVASESRDDGLLVEEEEDTEPCGLRSISQWEGMKELRGCTAKVGVGDEGEVL